jgi:hypothetical protein
MLMLSVAAGVRSAGSMTKRFPDFARRSDFLTLRAIALYASSRRALLTALTPNRRVVRRESLLRSRPCSSRIRFPAALLRGRRRHAVAVVLDLRSVGLSAFSIMVVREARLRARAWRRNPPGHCDAPSSVDPLSERTSSIAPQRTAFKDCVRTARAIFPSPLGESASAQWEGCGRLDSCKRSTSTSLTGTRSISADRSTQPSA